MAKILVSLIVAVAIFFIGLFLGSLEDTPTAVQTAKVSSSLKSIQISADSLPERYDGENDELDSEYPAFDASDVLTEALLVEEIELLKEDILDLEGYIYELTSAEGMASQVVAKANFPALSEEGYLSDLLIDELELSSHQITQVNTVLSWAKGEVDTLSKAREKITRPKKDLYQIQQREFRKDGKDIKRSVFETLAQEIGETKAKELFRRANKDFKNTYHNFGQSGQRTTIKLNPKGLKNKGGVFIKDEHTEYLPGNRTILKVDSGFYKQFPKRYEHLLDMEF